MSVAGSDGPPADTPAAGPLPRPRRRSVPAAQTACQTSEGPRTPRLTGLARSGFRRAGGLLRAFLDERIRLVRRGAVGPVVGGQERVDEVRFVVPSPAGDRRREREAGGLVVGRACRPVLEERVVLGRPVLDRLAGERLDRRAPLPLLAGCDVRRRAGPCGDQLADDDV